MCVRMHYNLTKKFNFANKSSSEASLKSAIILASVKRRIGESIHRTLRILLLLQLLLHSDSHFGDNLGGSFPDMENVKKKLHR